MSAMNINIPNEWTRSGLTELSGLVMVIGEPNTGKSTLSAYLFDIFSRRQSPSAYLDGDPGQSSLGPPTTITLALGRQGEAGFPPKGIKFRKFIASTSPKGHMLPLLAGAGRLVGQARQMGFSNIVYDTSGLVDQVQGGIALKYAKIDMLEPLLRTLKRSGRTRVVRLLPSLAVVNRDTSARRHYRAEKFGEYFSQAGKVILDWQGYGVFPGPRFALNRLVGLEDRQGITLGLGIVLGLDRTARQVELLTPLEDLSALRNIYLGGVLVDPNTYMDQRMGN
jgi:polynucleotide 5'-kinase involved in rRNA processing